MKVNGAAVRAQRVSAPGYMPQQDAVRAVNRLLASHLPPLPRWTVLDLALIERGERTEIPEYEATVLAAVLGVGLSEILDLADPALVLAKLGEELAESRSQLNLIARHIDEWLAFQLDHLPGEGQT